MSTTRKIPVRFDHAKHEIILYKWFEEKARYPENAEYKMLSDYMKTFPNYTIIVRKDININTKQEHYNGLSYEYMKWYIEKYEPKETKEEVLSELKHRIDISKCHSKGRRYPAIKKWFLEKYEAVKTFGMNKAEMEEFEKYKNQQAFETSSEGNQEEETELKVAA